MLFAVITLIDTSLITRRCSFLRAADAFLMRMLECHINYATRTRYDVRFTRAARGLRLRGARFFFFASYPRYLRMPRHAYAEHVERYADGFFSWRHTCHYCHHNVESSSRIRTEHIWRHADMLFAIIAAYVTRV